jgi:hypothetical protein
VLAARWYERDVLRSVHNALCCSAPSSSTVQDQEIQLRAHSTSHIAVHCLETAAPHCTQQLPDSIADKIPESAIAEHTAKVTSALKGLTGSTLAAGDAPVTSSATSTATGGSGNGGIAAEVQKQIDAGAAAVTTGITTQITGLTGKVYYCTSTLLHCARVLVSNACSTVISSQQSYAHCSVRSCVCR